LIRVHKRDRDERGQTLIFFVLAMPVFLAVIALVVDGSMLLVKKRGLQNAADAAALAAAQRLSLSDPCAAGSPCLTDVGTYANEYSDRNGGPSLDECDSTHPTNCFAVINGGKQVEVRLQAQSPTFFARAIGLSNPFDVSARAVAAVGPIVATTVDPGTPDETVTIPGGTHTTTDPDEVSGGSGVAFTMSRVCNAIVYQGAGSGTAAVGAFATNGGVAFSGNRPKKMTWLGFDQTRCPNNPPSPPSGTNQCTATAWGDATDSDNYCAKTLINLNKNNTLPINWPLSPPAEPTPRSGTWNPSVDYPGNCINLGNSGTITFSAGSPPGPPGIYCVTGASTVLKVTGNGVDLTNVEGYTFFALGGAKINVSSNTLKLRFYWPSACGPRPTTRVSFTCFGRTIANYDPFTLLYATNQTTDMAQCLNNAVCLNGGNNALTGDIFAPKPNAFPPVPGVSDTGGTVAIEGGALTAGSGFIESWNLSLKGNTGSYTGTGASIVIPGGTHTTTDPDTVTVITGSPPSTQTTTVGTDIGLDQ